MIVAADWPERAHAPVDRGRSIGRSIDRAGTFRALRRLGIVETLRIDLTAQEARWLALDPVQARVRNARKRHLCDCRPGWEAKARPRVRSSTHSSQRLVSATCQPLQWSRSSAENSSPRARPPDYDESSARRDHQASAAVIALSASWMPSPTSPAVAAQCKGIRARAPGSQRCSSRVSGSGAVPS